MPNAAIILAAGRGTRLQNEASDKILLKLAGRPLITYSFNAFVRSKTVRQIAIVFRDSAQRTELEKAVADSIPDDIEVLWTQGGSERQDSVLKGLEAVSETTELVFIHDGARPLIEPETIQLLAKKAAKQGAASLARRVTDTIKDTARAPDSENALLLSTLDRSRLWAMETPQVFRHDLILSAYRKLIAAGKQVTDDTAALEDAKHPVFLVESPSPNPKLTTPADLSFLEFLLKTEP